MRRPATDHARDLLRKWSAGIDLEAADGPSAFSAGPCLSPAVSRSDGGDTLWRSEAGLDLLTVLDRPGASQEARPLWDEPSDAAESDPLETAVASFSLPDSSDATRGVKITMGREAADGPAPPPVDVQMAIATHSGRRGQGAQIVGQLLAYTGVLALTVGTCLVIWAHFAEMPTYAPTGWLVATGGQMLLFLGMVMIVTSGLEQSNAESGARIELIGDRLAHIEQSLTRLSACLEPSERESREAAKRRAA